MRGMNTINKIYHVTTKFQWQLYLHSEVYLPEKFEEDGFIHCSYFHQLEDVIERHFSNLSDLLVLEIDPGCLESRVIDEGLVGAKEAYPHIYGALQKKAISACHTLKRVDSSEKFNLSELGIS